MATFTVTGTQDSGAGSLRAAVLAANAASGDDDIVFSSAFDGGAEDLIRLTSGQIEITDGLTIRGGPAGVTITGDANGDDIVGAGAITDVAASLDGEDRLDDNSRIFDATADLTIDGLTLTGGRTIANSADGGAVRGGTITLVDSTVSGNSTAGDSSRGGGVFGFGVTLTNSTVSDNSTAGDSSMGGGISGDGVTLTNSTVSGNNTVGDNSEGGGVCSTFGGVVTLTNSTVSGNSTAGNNSEGGGVYSSFAGGVRLTNSIVLGNAAIFAGVDGDEIAGEGDVTRAGGNIVGGDLFDGDADVGDVTATEVFAVTAEIARGVRAGVLADNGGPTRTILIAADGPAVDAGGAATLLIDQRGLERVSGAAVDLGAVELGAGPAEPGSLVVTTALDVVANDGLTSLREAVFFANFEPGTDTITFDASVFNGGAEDLIRLTSGQIEITDGLTIRGGPAGVTITGDANGDDIVGAGAITDLAASLDGQDRLDDNSRIFDATADLTIDGLTLTGGGSGAAGAGDLTVTNSTVSGNRGSALSGEYVTLINSTVTGNVIENGHGGAAISVSLVATLINSTISGNSDTGPDYGNSVITYASYDNGWVNLTNSIVLGNAGGNGDRIRAASFGGANIMGTTLFDGTATRDVTAAEVFAATTEIAPGVFAGVLADNGGPTRTIAIRADGPAAGAADPANATATDQRGVARDAAPDLGAFEAGAEDGLKLVGGPRADRLIGGSGDDRIYGNGGNDLLCGLAGDDLLRGGKGRDILKGGAGDDVVFGDKGDDRIGGGAGDDLLSGGRGHDLFVFAPNLGADTIVGFDANPWRGQDRMDLRALGVSAASFASEVTIEQIGDDTRITLQGQGSILCRGIDGEGAAHIDQSDFLLLA